MSKYPSDHKISVKVEPMNGVHLAQCDFTCNLYVDERKILTVPKEQCRKEDDDTYILTFNTKDIGRGEVKLSLNIHIPNDADFDKGYKEVNTVPICTGVADI